ncbi:MAG: nuclear transport factor 2 family protein [Acidobacteria bacterium]|jgi:hypothetical protein|nr:nuclear transport factor 2 family protein [Acidobacteriota bacterium]
MTQWIRCVSVPLLVLTWARFGAAGDPDARTVEKAVLEAHQTMTAAAERLDAEEFFASILDVARGPVIQDGRLFASRAEALEVVKRSFEGIASVKRVYETTDVTVISEKAALLTGKGTSTVTLQDGRSFDSPFAVSLVFVLRDGTWKVLHGHYSIPNPR